MDDGTALALARTKFDAVLLDLDGTLVNSLVDVTNALNATLKLDAMRPVNTAEVQSMFGDGVLILLERTLRAIGDDVNRAADLVSTYLEYYEPNASKNTNVYPGVAETLGSMVANGFALAVVTNKPARAASHIIEALKLSQFVRVVVGGDSTGRLKPDPAPLQAALSHLSIDPARAVMVGDMHHDVVAARLAGIPSVMVSYGYAQQHHDEIEADRIIDRFADLPVTLHALAGFGALLQIPEGGESLLR